MSADSQVKKIFLHALDLDSAAARASYLQEACQGDWLMQRRIELMLEAHDNPDSFLDRPAVAFSKDDLQAGDQTEQLLVPFAEKPGVEIGRYKLLQEIGQGGFGVVYMAEQIEPVQRKVALKIIKPGMDTREVIARFEAERQALALMDHPNIAKVLDAGSTVSGRPYFVMELVKGVPITDFCNKNRFSTAQRLKLFSTVCRAVQHAHQKGVIHRDIKPSNVMITLHDGRPIPKVIDFGISKAISQRLTEKTLFTRYGQMIGTPQYMSPEQAEMSGLDVDTRSDIYSLGVLLYELLTGTTPLDAEKLREVGYANLLRMIQDEESVKPSMRLSTLGDELSVICQQRGTTENKIRQLIQGELDWIVMKALDKDRTRRYDSANALADDIQRHLGNEPVLARNPSVFYRFHKFVRRNKLATVSAAAVLVALVGGLCVALMGLRQADLDRRRATIAEKRALDAKTIADQRRQDADAQRNRAIEQGQRAELTAQLLKEMLETARPGTTRGPEYTVRALLDEFTAGLDDRLGSDPPLEAEIRYTLGKTYEQLNLLDKAETQLNQSLGIRKKTLGERHELFADSIASLGWVAFRRRQFSESTALARQAIEIYEDLGMQHADNYFAAIQLMAQSMMEQQQSGAAENYLKQHLPSLASRSDKDSVKREANFRSMIMQCILYADRSRLAEAVMHGERAVTLLEQTHEQDSSLRGSVLAGLAACQALSLDFGKSLANIEVGRRILAETMGRKHRLANFSDMVAMHVFLAMHRQDEANRLSKEMIEGSSDLDASSMATLVLPSLYANDLAKAEALFRKQRDIAIQSKGLIHIDTIVALLGLAQILDLQEKRFEADAIYAGLLLAGWDQMTKQAASPIVKAAFGWAVAHMSHPRSEHLELAEEILPQVASELVRTPFDIEPRIALGLVRYRLGEVEAALVTLSKTYDSLWPHQLHLRRKLEDELVRIHMDRGDTEAAEAVFTKGIADRESELPKRHFDIPLAQTRFGQFLTKNERFTDAEHLLLAAFKALDNHPDSPPCNADFARQCLHELYLAWAKPGMAAHFAVEQEM